MVHPTQVAHVVYGTHKFDEMIAFYAAAFGDVVRMNNGKHAFLSFDHEHHRHALVNLGPVENGEEAVAFLRREGEYADAVRPDLVLLDLNLPRRDGREVLAEIKADPELRRIPVVVLTTSSSEEDVLRSYDLHANAYITKPVDFANFVKVVRQVDDFFFTVVRLPPG